MTITTTNTPEVRISAAFKVGTVYQQFICGGGHNYYEVTARTAKFITVKNLADGTEKRCKVDLDSEKYYCGGYYRTMEVIRPDKKSGKIVANAIATIDAATTEVDAAEYAITAEAQDSAIESEIENAEAAKIERELAKLEKTTATSATAALEILNGLLPENHLHFNYVGTSNIAGVTYRHFVSIGTFGESTHKRMIEVVKADKLDAVILIDESRDNAGTEIKIVDEPEIETAANMVAETNAVAEIKIDAVIAEAQAKFDETVADSKVDDSGTMEINGEKLHFHDGKLVRINAPAINAEISLNNGRKVFRYRNLLQSKTEFFKRLDELADINAKNAAVEEFMHTHNAVTVFRNNFRAPFVAKVHVVIKSGEQSRDRHFASDFPNFEDAKKFVDDFKAFAGEMKFTAVIKRDSIFGEVCYRRDINGNEVTNMPATENDFDTQLADALKAKNAARAICDEKDAVYQKALEESRKAWDVYETAKANVLKVYRDKAVELTAKLRKLPEFHMTIIKQDGTDGWLGDDMTVRIYEDYDFDKHVDIYKFAISAHDDLWIYYHQGYYDTPAQVETVINLLKAAIKRDDDEFKFPTVDELKGGDTCEPIRYRTAV